MALGTALALPCLLAPLSGAWQYRFGLLGPGCCRPADSRTPLHETRFNFWHVGSLNATACKERCAQNERCDAYEINAIHAANCTEPQVRKGACAAMCWHFDSGGMPLKRRCDQRSGKMLCYLRGAKESLRRKRVCFVSRASVSHLRNVEAFIQSVYALHALVANDFDVHVHFVVTDKNETAAERTASGLDVAIDIARRLHANLSSANGWTAHQEPSMIVGAARHASSLPWRSECRENCLEKALRADKVHCTGIEEDFGYGMTDAAVEEVLQRTGHHERCHHVVVTNADNFYSKWMLESISEDLDNRNVDMIVLDHASHYLNNLVTSPNLQKESVDLGAVVWRAGHLRSNAKLRFCTTLFNHLGPQRAGPAWASTGPFFFADMSMM